MKRIMYCFVILVTLFWGCSTKKSIENFTADGLKLGDSVEKFHKQHPLEKPDYRGNYTVLSDDKSMKFEFTNDILTHLKVLYTEDAVTRKGGWGNILKDFENQYGELKDVTSFMGADDAIYVGVQRSAETKQLLWFSTDSKMVYIFAEYVTSIEAQGLDRLFGEL